MPGEGSREDLRSQLRAGHGRQFGSGRGTCGACLSLLYVHANHPGKNLNFWLSQSIKNVPICLLTE